MRSEIHGNLNWKSLCVCSANFRPNAFPSNQFHKLILLLINFPFLVDGPSKSFDRKTIKTGHFQLTKIATRYVNISRRCSHQTRWLEVHIEIVRNATVHSTHGWITWWHIRWICKRWGSFKKKKEKKYILN